MADEIQNPYNYMGTDIDRDLLLENLEHNVGGYIDSMGWDDARRTAFANSYRNYIDALNADRLSSGSMGSIIDSAGMLNDGPKTYIAGRRGKTWSQEEYDRKKRPHAKRTAKSYQPNRDVASYIDAIAKALYDDQKNRPEPEPLYFDFDNYGIQGAFLRDLAPNGGTPDINMWLNLDEINPNTGYRGTQNRADEFSRFISRYRNALDPELDFTKTSYQTRQGYEDLMQQLQDELAINGASDNAFRLMQKLGMTSDFYSKYFDIGEQQLDEIGLTPEQHQALDDIMSAIGGMYDSAGYIRYTTPGGATGVAYDIGKGDESYIDNLNRNNISIDPNSFRASRGEEYANYLPQLDELHSEFFADVSSGPYSGWRYIPDSLSDTDYSVLAYDPGTGATGRLFFPELGEQERMYAISKILNDNRTRILGPQGTPGGSLSWHKRGGRLTRSYQQGGGMEEAIANEDAIADMQQFAFEPMSLTDFGKMQRSRSRTTKSDGLRRKILAPNNAYQQNGFSKQDFVRLASIAADIGAVCSPEMISSAALGLTSDFANLYADVKDGYSLGQSLGRFAAGVGMSAIGVIPIIGQTVGSGAKVVKGLVKMLPRINNVIMVAAAAGLLSNSEPILRSLSKIGKSGAENKMDINDWRNIGMALQFCLGAGRGLKTKRRSAELLKKSSKPDNIDLVVRDRVTGEEQRLRFGGDEAKELRNSNGDLEKAQEILGRHKSLNEQYEIATDNIKGQRHYFQKDADGNRKWYSRDEKTLARLENAYDTRWQRINGPQRQNKLGQYFRRFDTMSHPYWIDVDAGAPNALMLPAAQPATIGPEYRRFEEMFRPGSRLRRNAMQYPNLRENMAYNVNVARPSAANIRGFRPNTPNNLYSRVALPNGEYRYRDWGTSLNDSMANITPLEGEIFMHQMKQGGRLSADERVKRIIARRKGGLLKRPFELGPYTYQSGGSLSAGIQDWIDNYTGLKTSNFSNKVNFGSQNAYGTALETNPLSTGMHFTPDNARIGLGVHNYTFMPPNSTTKNFQIGSNTNPNWEVGLNRRGRRRQKPIAPGPIPSNLTLPYGSGLTNSGAGFNVPIVGDFSTGNGLTNIAGYGNINSDPTGQGFTSGGSNTNLVGESGEDEKGSALGQKIKDAMGNYLGTKINDPFEAIKYASEQAYNKKMYKDYKFKPFLSEPIQYNSTITGDEASKQAARRAAGQLNHQAAAYGAMTSDAASALAAQLQATSKAQEYIESGKEADNKAISKSIESAQAIQDKNKELEHSVAENNAKNIYQEQETDLLNKATRDKDMWQSKQNYLTHLQGEFNEKREEHNAEFEYFKTQDDLNKIARDLAGNGISMSQEDQKLIDDLYMGRLNENKLTNEQKQRLSELQDQIENAYNIKYAQQHGIRYRGYEPLSVNTNKSNYNIDLVNKGKPISNEKRGGKVLSDKQAELEYKKNLALMEAREKRLRRQMEQYEKELDRMAKSSRSFIKDQTNRK